MTAQSIFLYMLLASNLAVLTTACVLLTRFERRWKQIEDTWDDTVDPQVRSSVEITGHEQLEATQRLERRLGELQRAIKVMEIRAPAQQLRAERKLPLDNAVRMAKLGASVDDLTRNCGLSIGEARLMRKIHGNVAITVAGQ